MRFIGRLGTVLRNFNGGAGLPLKKDSLGATTQEHGGKTFLFSNCKKIPKTDVPTLKTGGVDLRYV